MVRTSIRAAGLGHGPSTTKVEPRERSLAVNRLLAAIGNGGGAVARTTSRPSTRVATVSSQFPGWGTSTNRDNSTPPLPSRLDTELGKSDHPTPAMGEKPQPD